MWIAESTTGSRIYCIKKTESEVHGWLHQHFPIGQRREVFWVKGQIIPIFERPHEWTEWIKKELNMALPEPIMVRALTPKEEKQFKRAISSKNRSFFDD